MSDFQYNEELSATMGLVKSQSAELDRLRAENASLRESVSAKDLLIASLKEELTKCLLERLKEQESISSRVEYSYLEKELADAYALIDQLKTYMDMG